MCRERKTDNKQVDNTANEQYNQLLAQLHDELNELLLTTAHLQAESARLEDEARKLINENIQIQLEARLLKDKSHFRKRYSVLIRKNRFNFRQLKQQIKLQRKNFFKFERRLRAKYEQPLHRIVSTPPRMRNQRTYRRIRSMPSESND
ncbi:unnamed protein product [Adineta ricciae]|uniref:Uncharacterized protein n=1 Tax=Adineta ricciae TaxID=249248 RepID=A0A816ESC6_ADIRI|nr:unnamed protein product [Adineta ricciae]CAF1651925.1 unnamed protein product [Adineta ricciae]